MAGSKMRNGRRAGAILLLIAVAVVAYLRFSPSPIEPVEWQPAPDPGRSGGYAPVHLTDGIHTLPNLGYGPEAVAAAGDYLYTGLQDGRVMRFHLDGSGLETFAQTGGRPLGLKFDARGQLIVADAFRGLLSLSPGRAITVLADRVNGERMLFVNDLAIAADGRIWFSDSSRRFDQLHWMLDFWEARPTGRLLCYDPATQKASVVLDGLMFANGVALGPGDEYVLVAETLSARILRHWLRGPKAGQTDSFVSSLPGYPDNLTYDGAGTFWVALPSPRVPALERMSGVPWLRSMLFHIPAAIRDPKPSRRAWALGLNAEGHAVRSLEDRSGAYGPATSVLAYRNRLYFGSIETTAIGWIPAP